MRRKRGNAQSNPEEDVLPSCESEDCIVGANKLTHHDSLEAMKVSIIAEIKEVRTDVKKELSEATGQIKKELSDFRDETNQTLSVINIDLKEMAGRIEEAERRVSEMEECNADIKEVLSHISELQEHLQSQLKDLEARSRRNNIRIHGLLEGVEGDDILGFIEGFIKTELALPDPDASLGIQRCHRSLGPKPPQDSSPRSVVIYFLEFKTKERVLRSAWNKKDIQYNGRRVFFEQDYTSDTLVKRKAYAPVRKALKEKDVRFQTLYPARLRVHLNTGTVIYKDAQEAAVDLKGRGVIDVGIPTSVTRPAGKGMTQPAWETAGATRRNRETRLKRIQERLKEFRRESTT